MFDALSQKWQTLFGPQGLQGGNWTDAYGINGQQAPTNYQTDSSQQAQEVNYGDLGFNGDATGFSGSAGLNDQFLKNLGWTGGNPYSQGMGDGSESGRGMEAGYTPEWKQFLQDKGLTLKVQTGADQRQYVQAFGPDGQPVGTPYAQGHVNDDAFGGAVLAGGLFAGGAALGAGAAGGAGGAADAGGLAGTGLPAYSAPGTYGNAYALAGDVAAAPEGAFAGGAAGGGSAAADAAGMGLAEGAYPAGVGGSGGLMSQLGGYASDIGSFAKQNPFLTNVAGTAVNGLIGAYSSNKALNAQTDATNKANALWAPYRETGTNALGRINGLMTNPSSITSDPGYQFQRDQGTQAIDRSAASKGNIYSGATLKALGRYGTDYAGTKLDQAYQRYGNVAQLGATGTQNTSNNLTNLGQAGAGAALYQGQVLNQGVNNALGQFNFANGGYANPYGQSIYGDNSRKFPN